MALGDYYQKNLRFSEASKIWDQLLAGPNPNISVVLRKAKLISFQQGRPATFEFLKGFRDRTKLSPGDNETLENYFQRLARDFVTDDGQVYYLRAKNKLNAKDYPAVIELLFQALKLEGPQILIYQDLIRSMVAVRSKVRFSEIVMAAHLLDSRNEYFTDHFFEWRVSNRETAALIDEYSSGWTKLSRRQLVALAVAYSEESKFKESLAIVQLLLEEDPTKGSSIHPIIWFVLGKYYAQNPRASAETTMYLKKFLSAFQNQKLFLIEGRDPYSSFEKETEAKKLLVQGER